MLSLVFRRATAQSSFRCGARALSALQANPNIYTFPYASGHILTLLPTSPPSADLAIGTTTVLPPTPTSLTENPRFNSILQDVMKEWAHADPMVKGQAAAFASAAGSSLGSGGMFFPQQNKRTARKGNSKTKMGDGAGGASSQGGAGGGGRGGWVHVSDLRAPPDYGRIAWPEDIFGSLEVDGRGEFVQGENGLGNFQPSGTYRVITREGILGLSDFMRGKLVERLSQEEENEGGTESISSVGGILAAIAVSMI